jgi:transcriptional regulator with XRE-family HTH domain
MGKRTSPTVRRRRLAAELRRLRAENGIKAVDVAKELGCSISKISLMESGRVSVSVGDSRLMLEMFGVNGEERDALVELARRSKERGWWHSYNGTLPEWFEVYIGLECEASSLRSYEAEYMPGLLQTEEYMRGLAVGERHMTRSEEIDRAVSMRVDRQKLLAGDDAPRFWTVLNEAVLRRQVGSDDVTRAQLQRLLEAGRQGNITVQVLPFSAGVHVSMVGSFHLLGYPEPVDPDVVFVEYLTGGLYMEEPADVDRYKLAYDHLVATALPVAKSTALIREIMKEL